MGLLQVRPEVLRYERSLFSSNKAEFESYLTPVTGSFGGGNKWVNHKELQ